MLTLLERDNDGLRETCSKRLGRICTCVMKQDEEEEVTEVVEEEATEVAVKDVEASVVWLLSRRPMFSLLSHRICRSRRTEKH